MVRNTQSLIGSVFYLTILKNILLKFSKKFTTSKKTVTYVTADHINSKNVL